jgi:CHAT domain-containing protein
MSNLEMSDGPLTLRHLLGTKLSAALVVLSACETGSILGLTGDAASGHLSVSFPDAFLVAGATSVLSPLWMVEDQATSVLLRRFYSYLDRQAGADGALPRDACPLALSLAQSDFAQGEGMSGREHPFYWAAFTLTAHPGQADPVSPASREP